MVAPPDSLPTPARARALVGNAFLDPNQLQQVQAPTPLLDPKDLGVLIQESRCSMVQFFERQLSVLLVSEEPEEKRDDATLYERRERRGAAKRHAKSNWRAQAQSPIRVSVKVLRNPVSHFPNCREL